MNFLKLFSDSFTDNWDSPAITSYSTGLTLSYGGLGARIERVTRLLEMLKVKPGDHIAVVGKNSIDWITNYMAALMYGAVVVTVQASCDSDDIMSLISIADTDILFIDVDIMPKNHNLGITPSVKLIISQDTQTLLFHRDEEHAHAQTILDNMDLYFASIFPNGVQPIDLRINELKPDTPTAIFFTSGTTGAPKPVLLSSDSLEGNLIFGIRQGLFARNVNALTSCFIGNVWSTIFNMLVPLASGAHITVFSDCDNAPRLIEAFKQVKPQRLLLTPRQLRDIYRIIETRYHKSGLYKIFKLVHMHKFIVNMGLKSMFNKAMGGNCHEVVIGSTTIGHSLLSRLEEAGIRFTVSYGLVECGGPVSYSSASDFEPGTAGLPLKHIVKCRIRPIELNGLPDNAGILETRGMTVMKEYYNDPDSTCDAFTEDGWLSTRDLATINKQGEITIVGRLDSIIEHDGTIIVPEKLEDKLLNNSVIKQAVVVDRDGILTAIVALNEEIAGNDHASAVQAIIDRVNDSLPPLIHIKAFEISPQPIDMTLKGTVARYKYL